MDHKKILSELVPNIEILKCYGMTPDYDKNMNVVYSDLKEFLTNKFNNKPIEFLPNERIVFVHNDLDFFLDSNLPGFTLYNIQLVLRELDIPNWFCIVISNLPNYSKYTELARLKLTSESYPIQSITSMYFHHLREINDVSLDYQIIVKPFIVLSRLSRFHRTYFISQLFEKNLSESGFISYHNISAEHDATPTSGVLITSFPQSEPTPCHFLYSVPYNRNYPEIVIQSEQARIRLKEFQASVKSFKNFTESTDINDKGLCSNFQNNIIQNALVYVGIEASVNCPEVYLSECSFKGILSKRPFILFGVSGTIAYLKQLGFKTFDRWWSEDYDNIEDLESRVDAILTILDQIKNKSESELHKIALQMADILEYNFYHFNNDFRQYEKNNIIKNMSSRQ